jgi:ABC-type bacteriocin/lantibiotic exporter with double-glycine peptidase domain
MIDLYKVLWRATGRSQIVLIVLSILVAVLAAVPLQYQKDIVNGLTGDLELHGLLLLGAQYLGVLILSSGLKFARQYRSSLLGEAVIRRIRTRICQEADEVAAKEDQRGTLVTMIAAEAEEIGTFAGAAIADPVMQFGTLMSVIAYIGATQPYLGMLMAGIVIPQAVIVVLVQKHVNAKVEDRVKVLRRATNRITTEDIKRVEQAVLADFDEIYEARRKIFLFKLSTKFAQNAINGLGTVGILMLGGWLALEGRTDIGSLVVALTGMERISQPWRELIAFYRILSAVRVKYELLVTAARLN